MEWNPKLFQERKFCKLYLQYLGISSSEKHKISLPLTWGYGTRHRVQLFNWCQSWSEVRCCLRKPYKQYTKLFISALTATRFSSCSYYTIPKWRRLCRVMDSFYHFPNILVKLIWFFGKKIFILNIIKALWVHQSQIYIKNY